MEIACQQQINQGTLCFCKAFNFGNCLQSELEKNAHKLKAQGYSVLLHYVVKNRQQCAQIMQNECDNDHLDVSQLPTAQQNVMITETVAAKTIADELARVILAKQHQWHHLTWTHVIREWTALHQMLVDINEFQNPGKKL